MTALRVNVPVRARGKFVLRTYDKDMHLKRESGVSGNMILNTGLDQMGSVTSGSLFAYAAVGSGSTAVSADQTALVSQIARSSTIQGNEAYSAQSDAPYYFSYTVTRRFAAGSATGNIAEVGMAAAATGDLFNRALVLDASGDPTVIPVEAEDTLDVTFTYEMFVNTNDVVSTVTISGVDYTVTIRPEYVTSASGSAWNPLGAKGLVYADTSRTTSFTGGIAAITSGPSGGSAHPSSVTLGSYTAGSYAKSVTAVWGLNSGSASVQSVEIQTSLGAYQIGFNPVIPKTSSNILTLVFAFSWGRYAS